ncbi:cytosolic non-specific dipeptidase-like [Daphnia carinata]|uniref:cytosolic non-specific dipeptidase-like n=1 Tax=Daphnia carinata TaxID=120202 RepID=UPI0025795AC6|nr:cytosolic non-specific dipeptidase-like [Daphnia carinata]
MTEALKPVFSYIDSNKDKFIKNLNEAVAIKSVSAWPETRPEIFKMVKWVAAKLEDLGATTELKDVGKQKLHDGSILDLPPVLFGKLGNDPSKKTVMVYGHLDVQPALKEDGWDTDPFVLTEVNEKLYGRGSTDDKGPVLGWIHAIEAFQQTGQDLPINIKFCFEGMEESGSEGLEELLHKEKDGFMSGVDYVCISDNYWLGKNKPCLTYGLRGLCYFEIEVACAEKDLHSGVFGGSVHEAMADLIYMMNTLVNNKGEILVPGIMDDVVPVTDEELATYTTIDFDLEHYKKDIGCKHLLHKTDKSKTLMHRWRFPALSLHGIQGAFSEPGAKTVIPRKVSGKFSIRIVPNQTPEKVNKVVNDYLNEMWKLRESPNEMKVINHHSGKPWMADPFHPHYLAGQKALEEVYGCKPDLTREGGSIPITLTFQEVTGKSVMLLPMGAADDGAHSQNEKIDIRNYIEGTKSLAAYLYHVAH